MSRNYAKISGLSNRNVSTPQSQKARPEQILNAAGGYVFKSDEFEQLRKFLILGSTGGTYYVDAKKLTKYNADNIVELFSDSVKGKQAVDEIINISQEGRAIKNDPAIFAMAIAASCNNDSVKRYALGNLHKVCRTSTHLFTFVTFCDSMRGWGRGLRTSISDWYLNKNVKDLALQVCKYPRRRVEGEASWSHLDLFRKVHLRPKNDDMSLLFRYVVKGVEAFSNTELNKLKKNENLRYIWAHERAKETTDSSELIELINEFGLLRESIPNTMYSKEVWQALLEDMPLTAMIRNLRNMSNHSVFAPLSNESKYVCERLRDQDLIQKSRVHPMFILSALRELDGTVSSNICSALEDSFYLAFKNVEPTNKNILLALDVSGSMTYNMAHGINMNCNEAAAAMAMVIARSEPNHHIMGFSTNFVDLGISSKDTLAVAAEKARIDFGGTDCALPAIWAAKNNINVDAFVILSDNESWAGTTHVFQAMEQYRKKMNKPNAKLVSVAMACNDSKLTDPNDKNSIDIVGFDSSAAQFIAEFIR